MELLQQLKQTKNAIVRYNMAKRYINNLVEDKEYLNIVDYFYQIFINIDSLAEKLELKTPTEIVILVNLLIRCGYLTSSFDKYKYKREGDIIMGLTEVGLAAQVIKGYGNCKHTAMFLSKVLDFFGIENKFISTKVNIGSKQDDFRDQYLLYNDIRKKIPSGTLDHAMNYYKDQNLDCFVDITTDSINFGYAKERFIYSFDDEKIGPLYNYQLDSWTREFIGITPLSEEQKDYIRNTYLKTEEKILSRQSMLFDFAVQNLGYYDKICESYDKIIEREKRLGLVK